IAIAGGIAQTQKSGKRVRGGARPMATLKCLACAHDNKVGDQSCAACGSSLDLKLCSACEAVNASSAERCHGCGAAFAPQAAEAGVLTSGECADGEDRRIAPRLV